MTCYEFWVSLLWLLNVQCFPRMFAYAARLSFLAISIVSTAVLILQQEENQSLSPIFSEKEYLKINKILYSVEDVR